MAKSLSPEKKARMRTIHIIIALVIMFAFRFLPFTLPEVTDAGKAILGVFIGTIYLWFTIDTLTASLISLAMICFSAYAPIKTILTTYMNTTLLQSLGMMIIAGALVLANITQYMARFFLTAKINRGRPWVFAGMIMLGSFVMAAFVDWLTPIFLFWPVLYSIFEEVGYEKGEKFPTVMLILVVMADLLGYHIFPFMRNPLSLIANYRSLTESAAGGAVSVADGGYMVTAIAISIVAIVLAVLFSKYVLRADASKLKNFDTDSLNAKPLPPMNKRQKTLIAVFILMILFMMIPSLISKVPVMKTISSYITIIPLITATVLCVLQVENKPVIEFERILKERIPWSMMALIATALLLASALTNDATGIKDFLTTVLSPLFANMSVTVFMIIVVLVTVVLTNIANSFVIGVIMSPIVATFCEATGANAAPIMALVIFSALSSAMGTPSASPWAATLYGNTEWLDSKSIFKNAIGFILLDVVVYLAVGIPLASALC